MKSIKILLIITLLACSSKSPSYIQGYIYSADEIPLEGIRVVDPQNEAVFAITNQQGYFRINQMINGRSLVVIFKRRKIGSIYIARTHPEAGMNYSFVEGRNDTLIINLKEGKIISQ